MPQCGKGLAGAAGHDELAAIVVPETGDHVVERGLLVAPQTEGFVAEGKVFRYAAHQVGPIERPAGEIAEAQHRCSGLQRLRWSCGRSAPSRRRYPRRCGR